MHVRPRTLPAKIRHTTDSNRLDELCRRQVVVVDDVVKDHGRSDVDGAAFSADLDLAVSKF